MKEQTKPFEQKAENLIPRTGGGPCEYKNYKGRARIISVRKKEMPKGYGGPSHESYEVKFSFSPRKEIKETHGRVKGREYTLKLTNSWYPGPKFLKKYGIEEDKSFDCYLKVITKGTCTPVLFDFPAIDRSDYFEAVDSCITVNKESLVPPGTSFFA